MTMIPVFQEAYGQNYELNQENLKELPESDIPSSIPVVYEDRHKNSPSTLGEYCVNSSVFAAWLRAGESDQEDYPIASRAYESIRDEYNVDLDVHALVADIQGKSRVEPLTVSRMPLLSCVQTSIGSHAL